MSFSKRCDTCLYFQAETEIAARARGRKPGAAGECRIGPPQPVVSLDDQSVARWPLARETPGKPVDGITPIHWPATAPGWGIDPPQESS